MQNTILDTEVTTIDGEVKPHCSRIPEMCC